MFPQDLKFAAQGLGEKEAGQVARFLGSIVGRAHGRQLDASARVAWRRELRRNHPKSLDAPSWLWRSMVELVAAHEQAYLDHCRRYALSARSRKALGEPEKRVSPD